MEKVLFSKRLKAEWYFQYRVWRSAIDWVVALYIIVPLLCVGGYQYWALWNEQASWPEAGAVWPMAVLFFIYCWIGNNRLFIEAADQLFCRQHDRMYRRFIKKGLHYSAVCSFGTTVWMAIIVAPLWFVYESGSFMTYISACVLVYLFRMTLFYLKDLIAITLIGWRSNVLSIALFSGSLVYGTAVYLLEQWFWLATVPLLLLLPVLYRHRLHLTNRFDAEWMKEREKRLAIARLFIYGSAYIGADTHATKTKPRHVKRPLLFGRSQPIGWGRRRHTLIDMFIKFIIRDRQRLSGVCQLTGVCLTAIILLPGWTKWVMGALAIIIIMHHFKSLWMEMRHQPFWHMLDSRTSESPSVGQNEIFVASLPFIVIFSFLLGTLTFSIWLGVILISISLACSYLYTRMLVTN